MKTLRRSKKARSRKLPKKLLSQKSSSKSKDGAHLQMFLVPCSCGTTFAVAENYDHQGTNWSRYLACPVCGKRHDPKNRLLQVGYHREGYWKVDEC